MNQPPGCGYYPQHAPRPDPQIEREAKEREAAQARRAAEARRQLDAEEVARAEAKIAAVPGSLFANDPEIVALTADLEMKKRQRPVVSVACQGDLIGPIDAIKKRIAVGATEAMLAAIEDVLTGDPSLRRAMVLRRQVEDDESRLAVLTSAMERLNRFGFSQVAREREGFASQTLEAALMERKRQYVREHRPETPQGAAAVVSAEVSAKRAGEPAARADTDGLGTAEVGVVGEPTSKSAEPEAMTDVIEL